MTEQITLDTACLAGVPLCVTERFLPGEGAVHTLEQTAGKLQMWRSHVDRSPKDLPPYVRFHILDGVEVETLLLPERLAELNWDILTR
ncbi:MAG: hypothetical protein IH617_00795 [Hydrogenophaga sp.]|nr:hypothetical protein [Hydrogenophaga sp.]